MSRVHELHELYVEASNMSKVIYDFDYRENDPQYNEIMDSLLEVQQKNNQLLVQVISKLRTARHRGRSVSNEN